MRPACIALAFVVGCSRTPRATPDRLAVTITAAATATTAPAPTEPAVTVVPDAAAPLVVTSATCAEEALFERMGPGLESGAEIVCRPDDGGTGFTLAPDANRARRTYVAMATIVSRQIDGLAPRRRQQELRAMEREAATDTRRYASIGLVFRNPERTLGKLLVFDGLAATVRERGGVTTLHVVTDVVARQRVNVVLSSVPEDAVVAGARVRVYGIHVDTEHANSALHGEVDRPVVHAVAVTALGGGA